MELPKAPPEHETLMRWSQVIVDVVRRCVNEGINPHDTADILYPALDQAAMEIAQARHGDQWVGADQK